MQFELHALGAPRQAQAAARRLLIVPFHNTVLDKARFNATLLMPFKRVLAI